MVDLEYLKSFERPTRSGHLGEMSLPLLGDLSGVDIMAKLLDDEALAVGSIFSHVEG